MSIEQEQVSKELGKPPAYWPSNGELHAEKLSARYSPVCPPMVVQRRSVVIGKSQDGPMVLKDVSFHAKAGERIGIGRFCLLIHIVSC